MKPYVQQSSYYSADMAEFLESSNESIVGALAANSYSTIEAEQTGAWIKQIEILRTALEGVVGHIFFEFIVPRIGSRIDAVLIAGPLIIIFEFKVGEKAYRRDALNQVWDYALDLKNFHLGSRNASIVPVLVATDALTTDKELSFPYSDSVYFPLKCNSVSIRGVVNQVIARTQGVRIDWQDWVNSTYSPTPTIIEAAQALFAQHSVAALARHDAGARNLVVTSKCVEELVERAQKERKKIIVFVTGVPGAGKTLVGLNVATKKRDPLNSTHAVFLSGNGPLVLVLSEALTRDEVARLKRQKQKARKGDVSQKVKAFIQNVHHFRDAGLRSEAAPDDHVVIFDEAQRAWNKEKTSDFMRRRRGREGFDQSEPEFLISYMDRHDWAAIICLVGGGQEIHTGEAGISEWLYAIRDSFPSWDVYLSPNLVGSEYAAVEAIQTLRSKTNVFDDESLHLAVSMRSFRAENVSAFVKAVLDCEKSAASEILRGISSKYPIALTRDLGVAKGWVRSKARGSERVGLVASSGAMRLKPHAIDVRVETNPVHYYLNGPEDTRSSCYLEDAATEFQVQGLELDWVCMTWDADLRFADDGWKFHSFVGSKWTTVHKADRKQYLKNAYRVLLTRARQGMVIYVPNGDQSDSTRAPEIYDATFNFLAEIGIPIL